jgi:hypothetical protein
VIPKRKEKAAKGPLVPIPVEQRVEQGRFFNRIGAELTPLPGGIHFKELQDGDQLVYIIQVKKSVLSPHQFNKRYYPMRMGANTVPAPHHYVEALFKKVSYPDLACKLRQIDFGDCMPGQNMFQYTYEIELSNQSRFPNEENLFFAISVTDGELKTGSIVGSTWTKLTPQSATFPNFQPILFYGAPYTGSFKLIIDYPAMNKRIFITVLVGGKYSPLKEFVYSCFVTYRSDSGTHAHDLKLVSENRSFEG